MASTFHLSKARNELADTKSCCDARGEKQKKEKGRKKNTFSFRCTLSTFCVFFPSVENCAEFYSSSCCSCLMVQTCHSQPSPRLDGQRTCVWGGITPAIAIHRGLHQF